MVPGQPRAAVSQQTRVNKRDNNSTAETVVGDAENNLRSKVVFLMRGVRV